MGSYGSQWTRPDAAMQYGDFCVKQTIHSLNDIAMRFELFTPEKAGRAAPKAEIVAFLHTHLEQYGDPADEIELALDYALDAEKGKGGFVLLACDEEKIIGCTVANRTGMSRYIPENILVYLAVDAAYRGRGLGEELLRKAIATAEGSLALHVDPDNPARRLYERVGFVNKYLEMRFIK